MKTMETDIEIRADGSVKLLSPLPPWLKPGRAHVLFTVKSLEAIKETPRHKITSPDITDDYSKLRKKIQEFQNATVRMTLCGMTKTEVAMKVTES